MPQSRKKIQQRLHRALELQKPVLIHRDDLLGWSMRGFVVSVSDRWVAVQALEDTVYLDGLELIRVEDVTAVKKDANAPFIRRALASLGRPMLRVDIPQEAETRDVIELAGSRASLVGIHSEQLDGEPLWIGRLGHLGKKRFELQLVGPDGEWDAAADRWRYDDITRISFGTRYIDALERFGDAPPAEQSAEATLRT
jgi:hypothetical protein